MRSTLPVATLAALIWTGSAAAHASFVRSEPADGVVLVRSPAAVRVFFDDEIRPARGILAVRNGDGAIESGKAVVARSNGRELVIPLRLDLQRGDYTARWRIVSDDGHTVEGLLAFAVGAGGSPPRAALRLLGTSPEPVDLASRCLFLLGVLVAAGALAFQPLVWKRALTSASLSADNDRRARATEAGVAALLAVSGFFLVFLGVGHGAHGSAATRYVRVNDVGALTAVLGMTAAALGAYYPRLRPGAWGAAAVLVVLPTTRGHAFDPGEPWLVNAAADLVHVLAVAVWLGGLLQLGLLLGRLTRSLEDPDRGRLCSHLARRFSAVALISVLALGASGIVRAFYELSELDQLWTTGYGRAIVVKSVLLSILVALGWRNRYRLVPRRSGGATLTPLRRSVVAEAALVVVVVFAVAFLTDLRPGRQRERVAPSRSFSTSSR